MRAGKNTTRIETVDYYDEAPFPFNGTIDNVNVRYLN
jgi:hypothetical protein